MKNICKIEISSLFLFALIIFICIHFHLLEKKKGVSVIIDRGREVGKSISMKMSVNSSQTPDD